MSTAAARAQGNHTAGESPLIRLCLLGSFDDPEHVDVLRQSQSWEAGYAPVSFDGASNHT